MKGLKDGDLEKKFSFCSWAFRCVFIGASLYCSATSWESAPVHIMFSLPRTSINNYTNNEVLIGEGESHGQTSGPTGKSMA